MLAMPLAGRMASKFGCRTVLAVILAAFLFILPALAISPTSLMMAITLFSLVPVLVLWGNRKYSGCPD